MTLEKHAADWQDSEAHALMLRDEFVEFVRADPGLDAHRSFVEKHVYGFGERAFHWLWKLIVDTMPTTFSFLEIGVYKGQVLSLIRLLADRTDRSALIIGVTLLSKFAGVTGQFLDHPDEDYGAHIATLHDHFALEHPLLIVGDSTCPDIKQRAAANGPYDIVYVDGCHEYEYVKEDLLHYPTLVRPGGYLVVDDASCYLKQPFGFFQGIEPVCRAVRAVIEPDPNWEHLLAIVHNRVFRRIK